MSHWGWSETFDLMASLGALVVWAGAIVQREIELSEVRGYAAKAGHLQPDEAKQAQRRWWGEGYKHPEKLPWIGLERNDWLSKQKPSTRGWFIVCWGAFIVFGASLKPWKIEGYFKGVTKKVFNERLTWLALSLAILYLVLFAISSWITKDSFAKGAKKAQDDFNRHFGNTNNKDGETEPGASSVWQKFVSSAGDRLRRLTRLLYHLARLVILVLLSPFMLVHKLMDHEGPASERIHAKLTYRHPSNPPPGAWDRFWRVWLCFWIPVTLGGVCWYLFDQKTKTLIAYISLSSWAVSTALILFILWSSRKAKKFPIDFFDATREARVLSVPLIFILLAAVLHNKIPELNDLATKIAEEWEALGGWVFTGGLIVGLGDAFRRVKIEKLHRDEISRRNASRRNTSRRITSRRHGQRYPSTRCR